jgi:DNA mismatch repair protein MutS2
MAPGPAFAPGARVHVAGLGTGIVREVRNGRRYLIEVKGRAMEVSADRLETAEPVRGRRRSPPAVQGGADSDPSGRSASLDLHGKNVAEALEALDVFLNDALLDGAAAATVIHGRSGGALKAAVHRRLKELPSIRAFRVDPRNPGTTIVTFA